MWEFGGFLDEALCIHFVYGLCNKNVKKRLLAKKDLELIDTVNTAVATEIAENYAVNMKGSLTSVINKVRQSHSHKKENFQMLNDTSATSSKKFSKCFQYNTSHDPAK